MINLSVPDTIDERTINKKKLTPFTIQVCPPSVTFVQDYAWTECIPELLSQPCSGGQRLFPKRRLWAGDLL